MFFFFFPKMAKYVAHLKIWFIWNTCDRTVTDSKMKMRQLSMSRFVTESVTFFSDVVTKPVTFFWRYRFCHVLSQILSRFVTESVTFCHKICHKVFRTLSHWNVTSHVSVTDVSYEGSGFLTFFNVLISNSTIFYRSKNQQNTVIFCFTSMKLTFFRKTLKSLQHASLCGEFRRLQKNRILNSQQITKNQLLMTIWRELIWDFSHFCTTLLTWFTFLFVCITLSPTNSCNVIKCPKIAR